MTAETLIALRRARRLSQRDAALAWGIAVNTIWRWEHDQRQIPLWVEKRFSLEHLLLKKIEVLEKQVASLLSQIPRPERRRMAGVVLGGRSSAARGGRRAARA
jgi:transcriptional regulator with XRE-family HTH domain